MRFFFLCTVSVSLIVLASCGEAKLEKDIEGYWHVNKYLVNGGDRTAQLNASKPNYIWAFNKNKTINRYWDYSWDSVTYTVNSNWANGAVYYDTVWNVTPVSGYQGYNGTWLLTNSNKYIQTTDDSLGTVEYQIIEHKSSSLHLYSNGEEYYLSK